MDGQKEVFTALLSKANFDISGFSPALKNFIYNEVAEDRFPLGQIIKRAQSSENDVRELQILFDRVKDTIPEAIENMPWETKMLLQPLLMILNR